MTLLQVGAVDLRRASEWRMSRTVRRLRGARHVRCSKAIIIDLSAEHHHQCTTLLLLLLWDGWTDVRFISERLSDALCTIVIMRQIDGQCLSCAVSLPFLPSPSFLSFSSSSRVSCGRCPGCQTSSHRLLVSDSLSNSNVLRCGAYFESVICTKCAVRFEKCVIQMWTDERLSPLNGCLWWYKQLNFKCFVHT